MAPANLLALALATSLVCSVAALAIDTGNNAPLPVPVTGDNSGPRYDIDMGTNLVDIQATSRDQKEANSKREKKKPQKMAAHRPVQRCRTPTTGQTTTTTTRPIRADLPLGASGSIRIPFSPECGSCILGCRRRRHRLWNASTVGQLQPPTVCSL